MVNIYLPLYALIFLTIIQLTLQVLSDYILQCTAIKVVNSIRYNVIKKIIYLKSSFFDASLSGDITSILSNDTTSIYTLVSSTIPKIFISVFEVCLYSFVLVTISIKLTIVIVIMIPLVLIIYMPLGKFIEKNYSEMQKEIGHLNIFGSFITRNHQYIKINNTQKKELNNGKYILKNLENTGIMKAKLTAFVSPLLAALSLSSVIFTILIGFYLVSEKQLTTGGLVAYLTLFFQIIDPIASIGDCFTEYKGLLGTTERLKNLLENTDTEDLYSGIDMNISPIESIKFENVNFNYPARTQSDKLSFGLNDIYFEAKKGENVALVGPSGAGKTTIFDLLEVFYDISSGSIFINGIHHVKYSIHSLRQNISYVSQSYPLINGSIYDNIVYGIEKEISDKDIFIAMKKANFDTVVSKMPDGLNTYIGEDGKLLSGGEKQRLALARAFLKSPSVVLLDEVTSSLDAENEAIVQESIENMKDNKIVFTIAHRLSTIKDSDRIIFLQEGCITGIGTHEELMQSHVLYKKFIQIQFNNNLTTN